MAAQSVMERTSTETTTGSRRIRGMPIATQKRIPSQSCYLDAISDSDEVVATKYDKMEEINNG